jgi:hypothetical protein
LILGKRQDIIGEMLNGGDEINSGAAKVIIDFVSLITTKIIL